MSRVLAVGEELFARGHDVSYLGDCSGSSWIQPEIESLCLGNTELTAFDWIVIDSYEADRFREATTQWQTTKTVSIVDDHSPPNYADLYVAPGPIASWRPPQRGSSSQFLFGTEYLLIRKNVRDRLTSRVSAGEHALITAGGAASASIVAPIERALRLSGWTGRVIAITNDGRAWPDVDPRTEIQPTKPDSLRHAQGSKFTIAAAGVTAWELAYLGVNLGVVCLSEDQHTNYRWMTDHGIAVPLGRLDLGHEICAREMRRLTLFSGKRTLSKQDALSRIDGKGAQRVVDAMERLC